MSINQPAMVTMHLHFFKAFKGIYKLTLIKDIKK
jgi:hypothetical protein